MDPVLVAAVLVAYLRGRGVRDKDFSIASEVGLVTATFGYETNRVVGDGLFKIILHIPATERPVVSIRHDYAEDELACAMAEDLQTLLDEAMLASEARKLKG